MPLNGRFNERSPASVFEEMNQNREQWTCCSKNLSRKAVVSSLNPRNVNFMQRVPKQTGIAAADDGGEKGFHLAKTIRQLWRKRLIVMKEPLIAFLPRSRLLTSKLFAKVFTNERVRIQLPRIMRIFSCEESCSS